MSGEIDLRALKVIQMLYKISGSPADTGISPHRLTDACLLEFLWQQDTTRLAVPSRQVRLIAK